MPGGGSLTNSAWTSPKSAELSRSGNASRAPAAAMLAMPALPKYVSKQVSKYVMYNEVLLTCAACDACGTCGACAQLSRQRVRKCGEEQDASRLNEPPVVELLR